MFAPGLGQGFEFGVGRVTAERVEPLLDGLQLVDGQTEPPSGAEFDQPVEVERGDVDVFGEQGGGRVVGETGCELVEVPALDDLVVENAAHQLIDLRLPDLAVDEESAADRGGRDIEAKTLGRSDELGALPIGDPGPKSHLDRRDVTEALGSQVLVAQHPPLTHPIDEKPLGQGLEFGRLQTAAQMDEPIADDLIDVDAEQLRLLDCSLRTDLGDAGTDDDGVVGLHSHCFQDVGTCDQGRRRTREFLPKFLLPPGGATRRCWHGPPAKVVPIVPGVGARGRIGPRGSATFGSVTMSWVMSWDGTSAEVLRGVAP